MQTRVRGVIAVELCCIVLLCAWLIWLPMPYGSVVEAARLPLVGFPLALLAFLAVVRYVATAERTSDVELTPWYRIWALGGIVLIAIVALQLVPWPPSALRVLSPESAELWGGAWRIAALARGTTPVASAAPVTVDPALTRDELFRLVALLAAFICATTLFRTHPRRLALAATLGASALFQMLYGVRAAALGTYEIWGWRNTLIHGRVTGTFVNPNHFAHYVALALPMALFLSAAAWRETAGAPLRRRIVRLLEKEAILFGAGALIAIGCLAAVLVAQSRGGLLAIVAGLAVTATLAPGRRLAKVVLGAGAVLVLATALVLFLGTERTVARFKPNEFEQTTLVGRRIGIEAAWRLWQRFPILGSGAGTFEQVVSIEQSEDLGKMYHHAHNDYVELAATTGSLGFVVAIVALFGGYAALARSSFHNEAVTWRRRAFQVAALAALTIAMVHALYDFNFFIPSNAATLAVIAGAASAVQDHDRRSRR